MDYKLFAKDTLPSLLKTLKEWINIPSVYDENTIKEGQPFGKDVKDALDYIANVAKQDGFDVDTCDGYATEISFGEGEDLVMVLGHCDVVPIGTGWELDPYLGEVVNGEVYGRGSGDDKGPTLCAYYALKYIKDNFNFNKRFRLVIGGNEERGSACLHHYFHVLNKEHPTYGFTPDADFPVVYGEKGIMNYVYKGKLNDERIISLSGGVAANSVPDVAKVLIKGKLGLSNEFIQFLNENKLVGEYEENENTSITVHGKLAHGAMPFLGVNAVVYLLKFLASYYDNKVISYYAKTLDNCYGKNLGIDVNGEKMGELTMNVGLAHIENDEYSFVLNIRYPIDITGEEVARKLTEMAYENGTCLSDSKPLYVDPNSSFIKALMKAYVNNTGDTTSKPLTIGGGTYARETINSVAFGMGFPGQDELAHQANERISVKNLELGLAIYLEALKNLGEL